MSLLPRAIDALVALAGTVGPQVFDGPEVRWPEKEFLAIGLSPDDVTVSATRLPAGPMTTAESADIIGMIRSWSGGTDVKPHRTRAYALLDALTALIEADRTLGGAVDHSELTGSVYMPALTPSGAVVDVAFVVQVRGF